VFRPRKIPARKKRICHHHQTPHRCHDNDYEGQKKAEAERVRLSNKFKGSSFDVFLCDYCHKLHVGKVPDEEIF
jgi:hypothetical protein